MKSTLVLWAVVLWSTTNCVVVQAWSKSPSWVLHRTSSNTHRNTRLYSALQAIPNNSDAGEDSSRRSFIASLSAAGSLLVSVASPAHAAGESSDSFSSIAERAAQNSKTVAATEEEDDTPTVTSRSSSNTDTRTAYDFTLPMAGKQTPFSEIVRRDEGEDGTTTTSTLKAILVVNIKQDDPIARKNIPELITLAAKYGRSGEFAVVVSPTDQGYYEPDTSALIRLKLASEYGYGINPATVVTDKVNLLGTGAHPFWRWLEGSCRTPAGLGKIQGNFEKFLIDGQTGRPLRRYPRKYMPYDITDDIAALLQDKPLPPPRANFKEEWRAAANEAERDTYRFQKGLNVFDQ